MPCSIVLSALCPDHGKPKHRQACLGCNAAYQRDYLRKRGQEHPEWAMWLRAKKRARRLGLIFDLPLTSVVIPERCPVFGTPLVIGEFRSRNSPSLDRLRPSEGYVADNCRVVCDHANRLKSDLDLIALRGRAQCGSLGLRADYAKVVEYVHREELLIEVRAKAASGGRAGCEWQKVADFLDRRFRHGPVV